MPNFRLWDMVIFVKTLKSLVFLDEKRNVHKEFVPVIKKPLVRWVDHTMYSTILNYAKKIDIHHNVVYSLQKCTGDLVDVSNKLSTTVKKFRKSNPYLMLCA